MKQLKIASICWLIAAICFAVAAIGNLSHGSRWLGIVTLVLSIAGFFLFFFSRYKASKDSTNKKQ